MAASSQAPASPTQGRLPALRGFQQRTPGERHRQRSLERWTRSPHRRQVPSQAPQPELQILIAPALHYGSCPSSLVDSILTSCMRQGGASGCSIRR